jgi:hypothetical protein
MTIVSDEIFDKFPNGGHCQYCNTTSNVRQIDLCNFLSIIKGEIDIVAEHIFINVCKICMNKLIRKHDEYVRRCREEEISFYNLAFRWG